MRSGRWSAASVTFSEKRDEPAAWISTLLRWLAPPERANDLAGGLEEVHRERVRRRGIRVARVLTALEALETAVALIVARARIAPSDPTASQS